MTAKPRVALALPFIGEVGERITRLFDAPAPESPVGSDKLVEMANAQQAHGVLLWPGIGMNAERIAKLPPTVKVISTVSVGFDHIDVKAANARGIVVGHTPDVVTEDTADTHILLMLGAARRAKEHVHNMDSGWATRHGFFGALGVKVTGKTMGIVGMGRIGRAVAQRAHGFDMKIIYHNRTRLSPELEQGAEYFAKLEDMLPHCQVLSLNLPGGGGEIMNAKTFAMLPRGAVFVNSARGNLVDEDALIDALKSGQLAAAGLDVFRQEPKYDVRLNELPNTFLLPHIGSGTWETRNAMGHAAVDSIEAVLSGKPAPFEVKV
jgi:lactate dehydrogenase-like 2-hydroxyacid dehydrogenase